MAEGAGLPWPAAQADARVGHTGPRGAAEIGLGLWLMLDADTFAGLDLLRAGGGALALLTPRLRTAWRRCQSRTLFCNIR